ncbi:hypothetical protein AMTRI_Chr11g153290 [Amborella trichopoda]
MLGSLVFFLNQSKLLFFSDGSRSTLQHLTLYDHWRTPFISHYPIIIIVIFIISLIEVILVFLHVFCDCRHVPLIDCWNVNIVHARDLSSKNTYLENKGIMMMDALRIGDVMVIRSIIKFKCLE